MWKKTTFLGIALLGIARTIGAQSFTSGVKLNDHPYKQLPLRVQNATRGQVALPISASLKPYAPQAGNQGDLATCLAWASAYALTIQEARAQSMTDPTLVQTLFYSPAYLYYHIKENQDANCKNGADFAKAMIQIQQAGLLRNSDFNTNCANTIPNELKIKAFKGITPMFNRLTEPRMKQGLSIRKALAEGNPVIVAVRSLDTASNLGHALCVVGYDDKKDGGAFEVLNSIGTHFGTDGYVWMTYKAFEKRVVYAVEVPPLLQLPPLPPATLAKMTAKPVSNLNSFQSNVKWVDLKQQKIVLNPMLSPQNQKSKIMAPYKAVKAVQKGDNYQILVDNEVPAYVYIFSFDSRKVVDLLFPHAETISPYLGKRSAITLPSENETFYFDDNKGMDYCCILWSKNLLDMKDLKYKLETTAQNVPHFIPCLEKVLGEKLATISNNGIQYDAVSGSLKLNIESKSNVVAMIVAFDHQ